MNTHYISDKGDPASVQLAEVVERVKGVLGDEWEKTSEVRDGLGEPLPSVSQVRNVLMQLAHEGVVLRDPPVSETEVNGRTMRWRRAKPQPAYTVLKVSVAVLPLYQSST